MTGLQGELVYDVGRSAYPRVTERLETVCLCLNHFDIPDTKVVERAADLFLACACAAGDPEAIRYFEAQFLSQLEAYLARFALAPDVIDEIRQQLRVKLFVGTPPGIAQYGGHGPLGAWVRVTSVRMAIDALRSRGGPTDWPDTDLLDFAIAPQEGPESAVGNRINRQRFRRALQSAMQTLDKRDRTLLRLSVLDGLNIDAIGVIYRVHRATVARWFVSIRARVLVELRKELGLRQPLATSEVRSVTCLLQDDVELSARHILSSDPGR